MRPAGNESGGLVIRYKIVAFEILGIALSGLICLFFILHFHADGWEGDWRKYGMSKFASVHYHAGTITEISAHTFRVWQKVIYSQRGTDREAKNSGEQYIALSHSLILTEIDCKARKSKHLAWADYTASGDVLPQRQWEEEWQYIPSDSVVNSLLEAVCINYG